MAQEKVPEYRTEWGVTMPGDERGVITSSFETISKILAMYPGSVAMIRTLTVGEWREAN